MQLITLKVWTLWRKRKRSKDPERRAWLLKPSEYWQLQALLPPPRPPPVVANIYTLKEMCEATINFSDNNLLGEGGFGKVFRGVLKNGQVVAIKQMEPILSKGVQGEREFRVEVDVLSRLNHPNLVNLLGYCADKGQRILVYEFMPQGSLQEHLHGILKARMNWLTRLGIALGAAKALDYLHLGPAMGNRIIHRDLKSSNILLDDKFEPKVSDFGLAKLVPFGKTYVTTRVLGTFGYLDPQYTATGRLTSKSDVYAFGVVMLELLTGRKPVDATQSLKKQNLVGQVRDSLRNGRKLRKILDSEIKKEGQHMGKVKRYARLAFNCVRDDDIRRPTMSECVRVLERLHTRTCSS